MRGGQRALRPWICTAMLASGLIAPGTATSQASAYEELQNFTALLNHIRLNYVDQVEYSHLTMSAMRGVLAGLDPHSYFLTVREQARLESMRSGDLAGVGMYLEQVGESVVVLAVMRDSPAERADIHPGDRLVAIDDTAVVGLGARELEARLAGDSGSRVWLGLERGHRLEPQVIQVSLKRKKLREVSVAEAAMFQPGVGYVRLAAFNARAADELEDATKELVDEGATVLLLDLRGNPGGIVDEASEIASLFLPKNRLLFTTRGQKGSINEEVRTRGNGKFRDLGLVLLIDEGSASASEILAASLQDNDRALIVGRRSFGKALMQTAFFLPEGDVVMLTVGRVYSPSGRLIQRPYSGITTGQYRSLAGEAADDVDSVEVFHTVGGRPVRAGGGVRPDVVTAGPSALPTWWAESDELGLPLEVATAGAGEAPEGADEWASQKEDWTELLVDPFLDRIRQELSVPAEVTAEQKARLGRELALLVAGIRWGRAGHERFALLTDPDIAAAFEAYREWLTGPDIAERRQSLEAR